MKFAKGQHFVTAGVFLGCDESIVISQKILRCDCRVVPIITYTGAWRSS